MVTSSARLGPLSEYTTNYRPVLSSERAFHRNKTQISDSNIPTGSNIWSQVPRRCSIPRHTEWPTFSPKITSDFELIKQTCVKEFKSYYFCHLRLVIGVFTSYASWVKALKFTFEFLIVPPFMCSCVAVFLWLCDSSYVSSARYTLELHSLSEMQQFWAATIEAPNKLPCPSKHIIHHWSASELYRPSDRRLSEKFVSTFADRRCDVVSLTDSFGCILCFLDRNAPLVGKVI
jgi:hypothetical protein